MNKSKFSRILPILLVVFVVIISIAAIVVLIKNSSRSGGGAKETKSEVIEAQKKLLSTSSDRSVRMSVRGQLVADEEFNSYRVTISPDSRKIQLYDGYLDKPLKGETLSNNIKAYEEFVYTLSKAGFVNAKLKNNSNDVDLRGVCASGNIYIFDIMKGDQVEKSYWTTTCKDVKGNFTAPLSYVRNVFFNQIPSSVDLVKSISDTKKF